MFYLTVVWRVAGGVLTLENATGRLAGGSVTAAGGLALLHRDGQESQRLTIEATGLDLGTWLPAMPGAQRLGTAIDLAARVEAREPGLSGLQVEGDLSRATVTAGSQRLDLETPVRWRFASGRLDPLTATLAGPSGRLVLEASFDASAAAPRMDARLSGATDLALLAPLLADLGSMAGPVRTDMRLGYGPAGVDVRGEARTEGARLTLKTPPLVVTNVSGTLRATGSRLDLADWTGEVGDGRLAGGGPIRFTDDGLAVDLALRANEVPLQYPEGMRSRFTGETSLVGGDGRFRLSGDVKVQGFSKI